MKLYPKIALYLTSIFFLRKNLEKSLHRYLKLRAKSKPPHFWGSTTRLKAPKKIPNKAYTPNPILYLYDAMGYVGIDLWQVFFYVNVSYFFTFLIFKKKNSFKNKVWLLLRLFAGGECTKTGT